jgi:hypothetical protein
MNMCKHNSVIWLVAGLLIGGSLYVWWKKMPEHKKEFLMNLIRQVPDLPGRYMA